MAFSFSSASDEVVVIGSFDKLAARLLQADRLGGAQIDPREEVFVYTGDGTGVVRPDGQGVALEVQVYDTAGTPVGRKVAIGELKVSSITDVTNPPYDITVDLTRPDSVEQVPNTTFLKARWDFNDGSTLTAVGKGVSQLIPLTDGSALMADAASMEIAGGTGRFEGARGIVSTIGTVFVAAGQDPPFNQPGARVYQRSIETFKVVSGKNAAKV